MKHVHLFSFSALAVSALSIGGIFLAEKPQVKEDIRPEPAKVEAKTSIPPMETPIVIELPDTPPPVVKAAPKPKPLPVKAKVALLPPALPQREMVCSGPWLETQWGGKYRNCEMK